MTYADMAIPEARIPRTPHATLQHAIDTYASETNKVISTWREFGDGDLDFRPHPKSSTVADIMRHQLLSERRFFAEFIGTPEPPASEVLPKSITVRDCAERMLELALPRLGYLASQEPAWWLTRVRFFDVARERIWVFWRRVLHTAHHRTQLTVYLRLLERPVPPTYGPTADVSWEGADPTMTVEVAGRP